MVEIPDPQRSPHIPLFSREKAIKGFKHGAMGGALMGAAGALALYNINAIDNPYFTQNFREFQAKDPRLILGTVVALEGGITILSGAAQAFLESFRPISNVFKRHDPIEVFIEESSRDTGNHNRAQVIVADLMVGAFNGTFFWGLAKVTDLMAVKTPSISGELMQTLINITGSVADSPQVTITAIALGYSALLDIARRRNYSRG